MSINYSIAEIFTARVASDWFRVGEESLQKRQALEELPSCRPAFVYLTVKVEF
jgi:hypothetical protein